MFGPGYIGEIRRFETKSFTVAVEAFEEDCEINVDDDGETLRMWEAGEIMHFAVRVQVIHHKLGVVGEDWLGSCLYKSIEDFQDHRECARYTREVQAKHGPNHVCGSYFADMISEAIKEARKKLVAAKTIYVRH